MQHMEGCFQDWFQGPIPMLLSVCGESSDRSRLSLAHTLRATSHEYCSWTKKYKKYQTGSCSRVNWAKYSVFLAYLVEILIEAVPMKAIHIYIYSQVLSTTQRAHMVKQLHSSLRDSLPIGRRQSSHLKSSSCRCQSRMHLWSGTVNEMHKSYTISTQVSSCLLPLPPLQCLSQIPQFYCFRLCSIHAVSMSSCLKASSVSKISFGFHNCLTAGKNNHRSSVNRTPSFDQLQATWPAPTAPAWKFIYSII